MKTRNRKPPPKDSPFRNFHIQAREKPKEEGWWTHRKHEPLTMDMYKCQKNQLEKS